MELKFDKTPALVFVQYEIGDLRKCEIYQDGETLRGVKSISIRAAVDEFTEHKVEFVTGATKGVGAE